MVPCAELGLCWTPPSSLKGAKWPGNRRITVRRKDAAAAHCQEGNGQKAGWRPRGRRAGLLTVPASSGAASRHAPLLPVADPGQRVDRARCRAVCSVHYLRFCFQSVNYLHCVMLFVCAKNTRGLERTLRRQGGSLKAHRKVKTRLLRSGHLHRNLLP